MKCMLCSSLMFPVFIKGYGRIVTWECPTCHFIRTHAQEPTVG
jgi:hypothetical protein